MITERTVKVEEGTVSFRGSLYSALRLVGAPGVVWYAPRSPRSLWLTRRLNEPGVHICGARVAATFEPDES